MVWIGRIVSVLVTLFLLMDVAVKFIRPMPPQVAEAFQRIGYPPSLALPLGILLLACLVLYVIPRTAPLGATLLTGYLGGAVASHWRVGDPLWMYTLFPVYFGVLAWVGLALRDSRVRRLLERRPPEK